jgi:hypothetical protein
MKDTTPQAVQACHELLRWLIPHLDKFPRVRRFTLGERLESVLLEVLEATVESAYTRNKQQSRIDQAGMPWRGAGRCNRRLRVDFDMVVLQ